MKTSKVLIVLLSVMAVMILIALILPEQLKTFLNRPALYPHVLFAHIVVVTLFFANAVVGILWEARSLASGRKEIILHTYSTVTWLDARFSSPLIILSVITGIMLTIMYGEIWQIGWLSLAFLLFAFSGVVWIGSDIPTQYRIKKLIKGVEPGATVLPQELMRILRWRVWISAVGVVPLVAVFVLMVYKPEVVPVARWFRF